MQYVLSIALFLVSGMPSLNSGILEQYFLIHKSLAADSTAGVPAAALKLAKLCSQAAAQDARSRAQLAAVSQAATRLQTNDLEAARNQFGELSMRVTAWLQASGAEKPYQFYCPMANKGWLQQDKATRNPYFGKSMLTCGEVIP